jgi:hypothetical protein
MMANKRAYQSEVIVVGGGVAGLAAAVCAARAGAETSLIESYGFLGGSATAGLVGRFQPGPDVKGSPVIGGLYTEICNRLEAYDAFRDDLFDPEMMRYVAFDLCEEFGVRLFLHATCFEAKSSDGHVDSVLFATKQGPGRLDGQVFVDTTGDGTLSALAGAEYELGRDSDDQVQPMTLLFQLCNLDDEKLKTADWDQLSAKFRADVEGMAYRSRIFYYRWAEGTLGFVMSHVSGVNPLDVEELTKAEIKSRRQALAVLRFFRENVPGCERCILAPAAAEIGIRESRRIMGEYILTRKDVLGGKKFADSIGCSTSWIDMHNPDGMGVLHELMVPDDWFEIPLRSLIVRGFDNLLVAGRCMSATHEAQGAIREMPTCIETGQGAGVAAALAAKSGKPVAAVEIEILRRELTAQGVRL